MRNLHETSNPAPAEPSALVYRVGDMQIDARRGFIRRAGADDIYLRHQTLQVLLYLLSHRDRVIGKEELHRAIWGDVAVTDDALVQCVVDIRRALGDDSREQRCIRTVPRLGYRFVGPVEVLEDTETGHADHASAPPATESPEPPTAPRKAISRVRHLSLLGMGLVTASLLLATVWPRQGDVDRATSFTASATRRVVVFYFENQSSSVRYDWLRRGLADMVNAGLSRFEEVAVLSRQQLDLLLRRAGANLEQAQPLDRALALGRTSGAEAIVLGSFAELGQTLRVEARVHDARTGQLLGVESAIVERPDDVVAQVDGIALRVAGRLRVDVGLRASTGGLPEVTTNNLEAYRYYLLGLEKSAALASAEAIRLFEQALQLDPGFAMASARIGYTYVVSQSMPDAAKPYLQEAFAHPERLSEKDRSYIAAWYALANRDYDSAIARLNEIVRRHPLEVEAWWRLGAILLQEGRTDEARLALQHGLAADPYHTPVINTMGNLLQISGAHDEAIAMHRRYTSLAPQEANAFDSLGLSYQYAGRYAEALDAFQRALALDPAFEVAVIHLATVFYQLGRFDDAIAGIRRYIDLADFDGDRARGHGNIAWVEWRRGNNEEAGAYASKSAAPAAPTVEAARIDLALHRGTGRARELLKGSLPNRGSRVSKRLELYVRGELALAEGRVEDALADFRLALTYPAVVWWLEPLDDCLADALLRVERFEEAAAEYRRVLGINPNAARARYGLAVALDRLNQPRAAVEEYGRFLETWKDADDHLPELVHAKRRVADLATRDR